MALTNAYMVAAGRIPELFKKIRDGQAPEQFTIQLLKDWGFTSSNDRAFLPLLKALRFLSPDGKPMSLYHDYRDHSRSKIVMAQALRNAYEDVFLIKEHPTDSDKAAVKGKFKSYHNVSDHVASVMTKTFYEVLKLSDLKSTPTKKIKEKEKVVDKHKEDEKLVDKAEKGGPTVHLSGLHYNIQIHLPATKDLEVYNAIFKSLKEHLFEE